MSVGGGGGQRTHSCLAPISFMEWSPTLVAQGAHPHGFPVPIVTFVASDGLKPEHAAMGRWRVARRARWPRPVVTAVVPAPAYSELL